MGGGPNAAPHRRFCSSARRCTAFGLHPVVLCAIRARTGTPCDLGSRPQPAHLRRSEVLRWRVDAYAGFCADGSGEPSVAAIPLGRRLPAGSSGLPGGVYGRAVLPLRGLAPGGVCRATRVAPGAGALLPHRFTLTCAGPLRRPVPPSAVCSLWHFPAGRPDWVLPSTVPGGVRTFLGPVRRSARHAAARPTRHHPPLSRSGGRAPMGIVATHAPP